MATKWYLGKREYKLGYDDSHNSSFVNIIHLYDHERAKLMDDKYSS